MYIPRARARTTMTARPWVVIRLRLLRVCIACSCCKRSRARPRRLTGRGRACFPNAEALHRL